jgi:hypothetical protein
MTALYIESFPPTALATPAPDDPGPHGLPTRCVAIASRHPGVLPAVHRPEVNLAVWHRDLPPSLTGMSQIGASLTEASLTGASLTGASPPGTSLCRLMQAAPFTAVAEGSPLAIADLLSEQLPAPAPSDLLLDLTDLALVFAALDDDAGSVRVRLEALTHDGCSRWHADAIGLRLLCTYHGPGTEWLPLDGGATTARAIGRDTPPCSAVGFPTGAVAILKGEGYPDNAGAGCIHRSPRAGPGRRARLLLCIDQTKWNLRE